MAKNNLLRILSFFLFPLGVFSLSFILDFFFGIYEIFPSVDIPMHFLGGISAGYMSVLFLRFWREKKLVNFNRKSLFIFLVLCMVCLIIILWEFYEFLMNYFFTLNWYLEYGDTLLDLFMGMLGGLSAGLFSKI